jgi:hypothetical protein
MGKRFLLSWLASLYCAAPLGVITVVGWAGFVIDAIASRMFFSFSKSCHFWESDRALGNQSLILFRNRQE